MGLIAACYAPGMENQLFLTQSVRTAERQDATPGFAVEAEPVSGMYSIGHQQAMMALHSLAAPPRSLSGWITWNSTLRAVGALA
jgi:hypothetical protein